MVLDPGSPTPRARRGRSPLALVVHDPPPEELSAPIDWSGWYLTDEDDMGEGIPQGEIAQVVQSSITTLAEERAWTNTYVTRDNFFAWVEKEPLVRVSPDVYLLDDPPPHPRPKMWQTWLPGHKPPRWALEIVSDDWKKDDNLNPRKYAQLGVRELVIFDPEVAGSSNARNGRAKLQVYRRDADGAFVRVYRGEGPAFSEELGAYLIVRTIDGGTFLRLARDAAGADLVPTTEERASTAEERAKAAEERANAAEERLRALEAELARARSK